MVHTNNSGQAIVSICMITYNHELFIKDAIEGVLMQQTSFPKKLIIGEDCSSDNTRSICEEYQKRFPHIIELLPSNRNIGMTANFIRTLQACKGKYIAICEGDDYWNDPNKIQKQVDFLDKNEDYILCHHDAIVYEESGRGLTNDRIMNLDSEIDHTTEDLVALNRVSTLTVVFRNNFIKEYPDYFFSFITADWPLWIMLSKYGKLKYLPFIGSVYRVHNNSVTSIKRASNIITRRKNMIRFYNGYVYIFQNLKSYFDGKYDIEFDKQINHFNDNIFLYFFSLRNYIAAKHLISKKKINWYSMNSTKDRFKYLTLKTLPTPIIKLLSTYDPG